MKKKVLVIGAGPAGLTAAYELLARSEEYDVTVFEESGVFGGISRTVAHHGNRMDMGGHRFFSKVPEVNDWWEKMLPAQGAMPYDDVRLGRTSTTVPGGRDEALARARAAFVEAGWGVVPIRTRDMLIFTRGDAVAAVLAEENETGTRLTAIQRPSGL